MALFLSSFHSKTEFITDFGLIILVEQKKQLIVPSEYRSQIIKIGHDNVMSGQLGKARTTDRILRRFWWPRIYKDIGSYIKSCTACQMTARRKPKEKVPLRSLPTIISYSRELPWI